MLCLPVERQEACFSRDSFFVLSKTGHLIDPKTLGNRLAFQDNKADPHHGFLPPNYYSNY